MAAFGYTGQNLWFGPQENKSSKGDLWFRMSIQKLFSEEKRASHGLVQGIVFTEDMLVLTGCQVKLCFNSWDFFKIIVL
jgi:hypothetical protein